MIANVPFAMVRKPEVLAPWTVKAPPGLNWTPLAALVPLFRTTVRTLVEEPASLTQTVLPAPVNVMFAPAVFPFVLKSIVPTFVRWPATDSMWPVCAPPAADRKVPATVALPPRVSVRAVVSSNSRVPPAVTMRSRATAAVSIVTVQPVVIATLSAAVGTAPPDHVAPELQLPPGATHVMSARGAFGAADEQVEGTLEGRRQGGR